uniref:Anoctamin n=1 Tax=Astyanax mexicanus TaxID=7994 RepID=A0A8B9LQF6_ASTMX
MLYISYSVYGCVSDYVLVWEIKSRRKRRYAAMLSVLLWDVTGELCLLSCPCLQEETSSAKKTIHYLKLSAPWDVLVYYAEELCLRAPLQAQPHPDFNTSARVLQKLWVPNVMADFVPNRPVDYYTCAFRKSKMEKFLGSEDHQNYFSITQRHRIVYEILARTVYGKRKHAEVGAARLLNEGAFKAAFPLHEGPFELPDYEISPDQLNKRQILYHYWARWSKWYKYQPLDHIREYFGEKIALYFAWLGFYTAWLLPAAIVGTFVFVSGIMTMGSNTPAKEICESGGHYLMCPLCETCKPWNMSDICPMAQVGYLFDHPGTVFFSVFMSFWAVTFLEYWKQLSPESLDLISQNIQIYQTFQKTWPHSHSYSFRLLFTEMHRTQTQYEDAFTFKVFIFQFVNFYSSPFYVAFFKGRFVGYPGHYGTLFGMRNEDCGPGGCLIELAEQLFIIMIGKQLINNVQEFVIPKVKAWRQKKALASVKKAQGGLEPQRWEQDYELVACEGLFDEYLEIVLQFGFITIFVAAFPLAPLFALLNNWAEVRLDAHKFVCEYRRPVAERAQNIGVWFIILEALSHVSVIVNAFLIAFTSDFLPRLLYRYKFNSDLHGYVNFTLAYAPPSYNYSSHGMYKAFRDENGSYTLVYWELLAVRLGFIIAFEHVVFSVLRVIDWMVPDVPESLELKVKRERYLAKQALADNQEALLVSGSWRAAQVSAHSGVHTLHSRLYEA